MNKDYCFTFQQHDFDYENQTQNPQNQLTTNLTPECIESSTTYEVVPNEEDAEETQKSYKKQLSRGYYFNAPKVMTDKNKLSLNLNAEQISLKSQHNKLSKTTATNNSIIRKFTINKSMTMAEHATTHNNRHALVNSNLNDNKQQQKQANKLNGISFKIAPPLSNNNNNNKEDEQQSNYPEIVLTSVESATTNATKLIPKKCSVKFQGVNQPIVVNNTPPPPPTSANDKLEDFFITDAEDSSELTSLPGNSTSPESILDNILSAASSVSVRNSSSLSSMGSDMTQFCSKEVKKTTTSIMPQVVILHANEEQEPTNANESTEEKNNVKENNVQLHMPSFINWPSTKKKSHIMESTPKSRLTVTPQLTPLTNNTASSTRSQRSRTPSPSASFVMQASVEASIYPDELKCKICHKVLQDPRTLNCLHSFCFQCLVNENFKNDSSIPFWAQPSDLTDDWKVTEKSNGSQRSASPDLTLRSGSDNSNSPCKTKVSTLSFMRKKSLDKMVLKSKSESSSTSKPLTNIEDSRPKYIKCKICKFSTELPLAGLRQLPQNFVMTRKIEDCRVKAGDDVVSKVNCNLCYEEISATFHCLSCNSNLCTLCKDAHERQKSTANHQVKNIMDVRRAKKQQLRQMEDNNKISLKCNLHAGFEIKAFCNTCLQVVCSDCVLLLHKNHKIDTIPQAVERYIKLLRDSAENTRPLCTYAEHSIERLNEIAKGINQKCDNIQAEVENFMRQYYKAVEVHRKTMLQQVHKARENKVEMILEQQLDLEKRISEAMDAIRFTQDLTESASDVEILMFLGVLLKRFEYCQQFKTPVDPKISDSLHFLPKIRAPSAKNQNDIPLFGIITMQTVEPALCTLQTEGISQLRLHKKVELKIISRDAGNTELCHGGLQIQALLKYKEYHAKFLPVEVSDNRDGTYTISFTPDSQGTLILTVSIDDKPIKGTPFSILVRTVRPHTGIFHCCTFCSSRGNKLTKCCCEGRMPGYEGCGHGHAGHPGRRHWSCCGNILENSECSVANKLLNP